MKEVCKNCVSVNINPETCGNFASEYYNDSVNIEETTCDMFDEPCEPIPTTKKELVPLFETLFEQESHEKIIQYMFNFYSVDALKELIMFIQKEKTY